MEETLADPEKDKEFKEQFSKPLSDLQKEMNLKYNPTESDASSNSNLENIKSEVLSLGPLDKALTITAGFGESGEEVDFKTVLAEA